MEFDLSTVFHEMTEIVVVGQLRGKTYKRDLTTFPGLNPAGSQNFGPVEKAAQIAHGFNVAENLARFDAAYDMACEPHRPGISGGWMGSSQESRVYAGDHYLPWLIAWLYGGSQKALKWLQVFHAMAEMSATPEGRCLWVGQRGGMPDRHNPQWIDGFLDVARGLPIDRWRKGYNWGWPDSWRLLAHYAAEVREIHADIPRGSEAFGWLARNNPFTLRVKRNWLHRQDGTIVASWCESTVNGNTPPMMAAVRSPNGALDWLPRNGGNKRERQRGDKATCDLIETGGVLRLHYEATVNRPSPDSLIVPSGMVHRVANTDGSFVIVTGSPAVPAPEPPATLPPEPQPDQSSWHGPRTLEVTIPAWKECGVSVFVRNPTEGAVIRVESSPRKEQIYYRDKNARWFSGREDPWIERREKFPRDGDWWAIAIVLPSQTMARAERITFDCAAEFRGLEVR